MLSENVSNVHYCCTVCNKQYSRKSSLEKHKILCEFKTKTKREQQVDFEELGDTPTHYQLVKIVQELTLKMIKMEEKMTEMQKWVDKKKRKINVIEWLDANVVPTIGFLEWVNTSLLVNPEHFEDLMENSLFHTVQQVFEHNLEKHDDFVYPIRSFSQKTGIIYICEKFPDGTPKWKQMQNQDMVLMLKTVQNRTIRVLTKWKGENQHKFDDNSKISDLFNKAVIKLMNISFTPDHTFNRMKNGLFNYLKTDIKMMDFEFEF
jgi:hypothetical protein